MKAEDCNECEYFDACPMANKGGKFELSFTDKQRRLEGHRREEKTKPFEER